MSQNMEEINTFPRFFPRVCRKNIGVTKAISESSETFPEDTMAHGDGE